MSNSTVATPTTLHPSIFEMSKVAFSSLDFTLFFAMLGISALIGIYYGCCKSKQNTAEEYLTGSKSMRVFPVAMSLVASNISAIALLSVPADVYRFGATYGWIFFPITVSSIVTSYVFLPVFLKLELTSTYEYLNIRFDNKIRVMASFLVVVSILLYNPIVIYVPSLAFAQATGINLHIIVPVVSFICVFYTAIGGIKGVIWTDAVQTISMSVSLIVVFYLGITSVGGFSTIWAKASKSHRVDIFNFDIDITSRDSVWAFVIGASVAWISSVGLHQSTTQRLQAVRSINDARKVLLIFCIGTIFVKLVSTITGLIIYTRYADCDLLSTHQVSKADQLLPYYVMDVAGKILGLPGIFIAGVFSAGLSTLSTTLNSLSGIIYADFLPFFVSDQSRAVHAGTILKVIVVICGIISTLLVFIVEHLGGVLPLVVSLGSITSGPLLGLFCLGMLFPKANAKGALYGGVGGLILSTCLVVGNKYYASFGMLKDFSKPVSTKGCEFYVNSTIVIDATPNVNMAPFVFRIAFWYYTLIGTILVVAIGLVVSWFTNSENRPVPPELISPIVLCWIPSDSQKTTPAYSSVEVALEQTTN